MNKVQAPVFLFLSLAFDVMKQRKADMAYRSRAHRHPAHSPHTRRPRARPTPAGREGSDSLGRRQPEYVESWLNNAENKRGWSGSQVRLTRLELAIYRTEHFRPLAEGATSESCFFGLGTSAKDRLR